MIGVPHEREKGVPVSWPDGGDGVSIVCKSHRRRCFLEPSSPGGPVRIWHEGMGRNGGVMCSSQRFLVRNEREQDRSQVLGELAGR